MLTRDRVKAASQGEPSLLVLNINASLSAVGDDIEVYAIPLELRRGGLLFAIPRDALSDQAIADGQSSAEDALIGPSSIFSAPLLEESEDMLSTIALGIEAPVLVVDLHDDILSACREYDPVTDSLASILGFSLDHPTSLPDMNVLWPLVNGWLLSRSDDRTGFYSAQEDQVPVGKGAQSVSPGAQTKKAPAAKRITNNMIADQLSTLAAQLQLLSQRQDVLEKAGNTFVGNVPEPSRAQPSKLPAVSSGLKQTPPVAPLTVAKALNLVGPPPKVRHPQQAQLVEGAERDEPYDPLQPLAEESGGIVAALAQQSSAITALVAHMASQSGDAVADLSATGLSSSSTKGVQRREKMQNDLAHGTSTYFLQMQQQLHRRLFPSRPVPQSEEELRDVSVLQYLERQGGYRAQREMGLVAWVLGHAVDSAAQGDFRRTKEIIALLLVAVEQAVTDKGNWSLAFMLTLLEEPPIQVFQERATNLVHLSRPFGPLVPPQWTAVCLSYLKDLEVLSTKKVETAKKASKATPAEKAAGAFEPDREESPRRKPRFPKKPKAKASPEA